MFLRKLLISTTAVAALMTGSAFAADLPTRGAPPPAYYPPAPMFTWAGAYVGLDAGIAINGSSGNNTLNPSSVVPNDYTYYRSNNNVHFTGGLNLGYNWQMNNMVVGVEADINYLGRDGNRYANALPTNPSYPYVLGVRSAQGPNWFGTVRGRVGFMYDRALFYVTGGLAYGGGNKSAEAVYVVNNNGPVSSDYTSSRGGHVGWTLGAGINYALTQNWVLKGEYLYVDLGGKNRTLTSATSTVPASISTSANGTKFSVVRAGIAYKF